MSLAIASKLIGRVIVAKNAETGSPADSATVEVEGDEDAGEGKKGRKTDKKTTKKKKKKQRKGKTEENVSGGERPISRASMTAAFGDGSSTAATTDQMAALRFASPQQHQKGHRKSMVAARRDSAILRRSNLDTLAADEHISMGEAQVLGEGVADGSSLLENQMTENPLAAEDAPRR